MKTLEVCHFTLESAWRGATKFSYSQWRRRGRRRWEKRGRGRTQVLENLFLSSISAPAHRTLLRFHWNHHQDQTERHAAGTKGGALSCKLTKHRHSRLLIPLSFCSSSVGVGREGGLCPPAAVSRSNNPPNRPSGCPMHRYWYNLNICFVHLTFNKTEQNFDNATVSGIVQSAEIICLIFVLFYYQIKSKLFWSCYKPEIKLEFKRNVFDQLRLNTEEHERKCLFCYNSTNNEMVISLQHKLMFSSLLEQWELVSQCLHALDELKLFARFHKITPQNVKQNKILFQYVKK